MGTSMALRDIGPKSTIVRHQWRQRRYREIPRARKRRLAMARMAGMLAEKAPVVNEIAVASLNVAHVQQFEALGFEDSLTSQ